MPKIAFHKISCGGQSNWWLELLSHSLDLIEGKASLLLMPPEASHATTSQLATLVEASSSPTQAASLFVLTSGSTGDPKVVVLSRDNLIAANTAANDRLGFEPQWVCALPPDHIGGYLPVFRSLANGHEPQIALTNDARFDVATLIDVVHSSKGPAPLAVSLVWRQINRLAVREQLNSLSKLAAVLVGGGPASEKDLQAVRASNLKSFATYGMTETCGGVVWNGRPLAGVEIEIDEATNNTVNAMGVVGRITVIGPTVASGYWVESGLENFAEHRFVTSDLGLLNSERLLEVHGRADEIALINGYNVSLPTVGQVLKSLPGVDDAVALVRNDPGGDQMVVYIASESKTPPELSEVRAFLARSLGRGAIPAFLEVLEVFPRTRTDKIDLAALRELTK